MQYRARHGVIGVLVLVAVCLYAVTSGSAMSGNVTVNLNVASATYLSTNPADTPGGSCQTATPATTLGVVLPGDGIVTSQDCLVVFGSSNDTASLRLSQTDGLGFGMYRPPLGPKPTSGWDEGDGDQVAETRYAGGGEGSAYALVEQADGKVVVAGARNATDFGVARFTTSGAVDAQLVTSFSAGSDYISDIVQLSDGKLLAVGHAATNGGDVAIARYNTNLTLDTNADADAASHCSTDGRHTVDIGASTADEGIRVLPLDGGEFLVVASRGADTSLLRFDATCSLVTGWGAGGIVTTSLAAGTEDVLDAVLQPDGKILVAGGHVAGNADVLTARFNADGSLDTNADADPAVHWNTTGIRIVAITGSADRANQIVLQPDGKVVFGGIYAGDDWLVGRFNADGSWDTSFSGNGWDTFVVPGCCMGATGIALEATGSFLVAGLYPGGHANVAVARWSPTGVRDTTFNNNTGYIDHNVGNDAGQEYPSEAILGQDGRMYVAVTAIDTSTNWSAMVLQLATTTVPDYQDTVNEWGPTAAAHFGACLRAVGGGATTGVGTWSTTGSCGMSDADPWRPIAAAGDTVARAPVGVSAAEARLRFGVHTLAGQLPGAYIAPVTFEVVAPAT